MPLTDPAAAVPKKILEENKRLSQSLLWQRQRQFFEQQGIAAWSRGVVPHHATANPLIAKTYAETVVAFLQDWQTESGSASSPGSNQPVYIIELGAGTGRFGFLFLKQFVALRQQLGLEAVPVVYVMTDIVWQNIDFWQEHPALQPFLEEGLLDFAHFDLEQNQTLTLINSGHTLEVETVKSPLVVVANYFFASLPLDLFWVVKGELQESLVTLSTPADDAGPSDPDFLSRAKISYANHPASPDYYDEADFNRLLQDYQQLLPQTGLHFPVAALRYCRFFKALAGGPLLLLAADKGYIQPQRLLKLGPPRLAIHGGAFSVDVNFHALAQYFRRQGGAVFHSAHEGVGLDIVAFLLAAAPENYKASGRIFTGPVTPFNLDDFFALLSHFRKNYDTLTLEQLMALLRLSGHDPLVLAQCLDTVRSHIAAAKAWQKRDILHAVEQAWAWYYHLDEPYNLPFQLGLLMFEMDYFSDALAYFQHALDLYGPDVLTLCGLALCHHRLRQMEPALRYIYQVLVRDPNHELAQLLLADIQAKMGPQTG